MGNDIVETNSHKNVKDNQGEDKPLVDSLLPQPTREDDTQNSNDQKHDVTLPVEHIKEDESLLNDHPIEKQSSAQQSKHDTESLDAWIKKKMAFIGIPERFANDTAVRRVKRLTLSVISIKEKMRKSPWMLSACVGVSSFGVMWGGLFSAFGYICFFRYMTALIKVYQVIIGAVCLTLELTRYSPVFTAGIKLYHLAPILELNIGRGCLQLLTGVMAMDHHPGMVEWVPGCILALCGIVNSFWGIKCALQIRKMMLSYQASHKDVSENDSNAAIQGDDHDKLFEDKFGRLRKQFNDLDIDGDGRISKEELAFSCKNLNMDIDDVNLAMIFKVLDVGSKGYIDLKDFENWWYREKSLITVFLV